MKILNIKEKLMAVIKIVLTDSDERCMYRAPLRILIAGLCFLVSVLASLPT